MQHRRQSFQHVAKPWGEEILVEHTAVYALKDIRMKRGTRSSLQMHEKKHETIYVISGTVELETHAAGCVELEIFGPNEAYSIPPGTKHRVRVLEHCRLIEVSTPELDDVVRFEDDYQRA